MRRSSKNAKTPQSTLIGGQCSNGNLNSNPIAMILERPVEVEITQVLIKGVLRDLEKLNITNSLVDGLEKNVRDMAELLGEMPDIGHLIHLRADSIKAEESISNRKGEMLRFLQNSDIYEETSSEYAERYKEEIAESLARHTAAVITILITDRYFEQMGIDKDLVNIGCEYLLEKGRIEYSQAGHKPGT